MGDASRQLYVTDGQGVVLMSNQSHDVLQRIETPGHAQRESEAIFLSRDALQRSTSTTRKRPHAAPTPSPGLSTLMTLSNHPLR